jgi:hypothetical protein
MASITSANAIFTLAIQGLFNFPIQLQGFAADDISDTEAIQAGEVLMGVDGVLSSGFVFEPIKQTISIQADSISNNVFEAWYQAERQASDKYWASGQIHYPAIGKHYTLTNGVLTVFPAISDAKKVLQPRKYVITWESVTVAGL